MFITTTHIQRDALRNTITNAYRMNETTCLNILLADIHFSKTERDSIQDIAKQLIIDARIFKKSQDKIDMLLHQYDLSTDEGIALMCLAEALLRIPDQPTIDKFISDKISTVNWKNHLSRDHSLFINAATWSLIFTGTIYAPVLNTDTGLIDSLKRVTSRLGISTIRPIMMQMMKMIGKQFVMGESIHLALERASPLEKQHYRFSYDMLGEAARTAEEAAAYYQAYVEAIDAIGKTADPTRPPEHNPGISIKLSALHPRYDYTQYNNMMRIIPPLLLSLAQQAKKYQMGLAVDAEEADRLDLSLDIIETVLMHPSLQDWNGFGLAVQAYQKRAFFVIDWLADLAKRTQKRLMIRLVKGAYWDAEIKTSQVLGLSGYPVFTRKHTTDVAYLACAKKLLSQPDYFYSQFGTHNAYSIAAILELAGQHTEFEFQCLHGMGRAIYDSVVNPNKLNRPCRIYAPVGTHEHLLGYLVRRLLENGANSSFVNNLSHDKTPIATLIQDPFLRISSLAQKPHPRIPLPRDIYSDWQNSQGIDLSNFVEQSSLKIQMEKVQTIKWQASSIVKGNIVTNGQRTPVSSPANLDDIIGYVYTATETDTEEALASAMQARTSWANTAVEKRAAILERAAELFQQHMPTLMALLTLEGGKCIADAMSEVRETIDYCRYYAYRACIDLKPIHLPGPTGESNELSLHPRGVITCISPWNFPLAIFIGQIVAALVTGNTVIAKPAEQTPLIAFKAIELLHEAGIPVEALQLLIGPGSVIGAKLVSDIRIAGVMFTGSTETAKLIEQSLANRPGPVAMFIAETGGQNAMIVDSSALAEQTVIDIVHSAFNSAGQRCSALRVLFVQEEIAPKLLTLLKGYMAALSIGDPRLLATDIGPVIDDAALQMLQLHLNKMRKEATFIAQIPMPLALNGYFFAPCAFELSDISLLQKEIFGPILHVIRYASDELDKVMDAITQTGYGLTLGIHSRIENTIAYVASRMPVGNIYVNRNMIGAVVGVQPFGGERLSGTGPKAGGPHYLPRLCVERTRSTNTTAVGGNARLVSLKEDD